MYLRGLQISHGPPQRSAEGISGFRRNRNGALLVAYDREAELNAGLGGGGVSSPRHLSW